MADMISAMPRRIDYLDRVAKADAKYKADQERLRGAIEARRQAIGEAVANGEKISDVAAVLGGLNYESVRRIAAGVNGPRPVGRPKGT